jgi:hypothetical protein
MMSDAGNEKKTGKRRDISKSDPLMLNGVRAVNAKGGF